MLNAHASITIFYCKNCTEINVLSKRFLNGNFILNINVLTLPNIQHHEVKALQNTKYKNTKYKIQKKTKYKIQNTKIQKYKKYKIVIISLRNKKTDGSIGHH